MFTKEQIHIYHQPEKSFHCGACASATVLRAFGEEPDPIPTLYTALRAEGGKTSRAEGLYGNQIQSYFLRKDWVCLNSTSGGPYEIPPKEVSDRPTMHHEHTHQILATWRIMHEMLKNGFLCILEYRTAADTYHFAVVWDVFIRRNIYWLQVACSSQGFMEQQAENFLRETGTSQLFIKPHVNEYR